MGDQLYAIVTHGKIKSFEQLGHTKGHNDRSVKILPDNVRPDGPAPVTLVGAEGANLVEVAKAKLRSHGLDPAKLRTNAVIANEDIYSASPPYFGDPEIWRARSQEEWRRDPWVVATVAFLKKKHGDNLISANLHVDEKTPHIHAVTLPLVEKARAKRGRMSNAERALPESERKPRPTVTSVRLDCRSVRGQEKWQLESFVTEYADAVAHLGLARGRMISGLTKEERSAWAEKASPKVAEARRALEDEAAKLRLRELDVLARAEETDAQRRRLQADALVLDLLHAQATADKERALAEDRRRELKLAQEAEDVRRMARAAEQLRQETLEREAALSEREAIVTARDEGANAWDSFLLAREAELAADIEKLERERSLFEKTKDEFMRRYHAAMARFRHFFFGKGMTAEVDALDRLSPQPGFAQQRILVDPTVLAAAEDQAALRRLSEQGR